MALDEIDGEYLEALERLTTTVNQQDLVLNLMGLEITFRQGELLFEGVDGQISADRRLEITYSFAVARGIHEDDEWSFRPVGPLLITDKRGWDTIWVASEETVVDTVLIRTPTAAYVERVYNYADFEQLRLTE